MPEIMLSPVGIRKMTLMRVRIIFEALTKKISHLDENERSTHILIVDCGYCAGCSKVSAVR